MEFVDFDTVSSKTNQFINERKKRMETEMKLKKLIALIEKTGLEVPQIFRPLEEQIDFNNLNLDEKEDHDDFLDSVFLSPVKKKRSDGISTSPYEEQYNQKDVKKEMADFAMWVDESNFNFDDDHEIEEEELENIGSIISYSPVTNKVDAQEISTLRKKIEECEEKIKELQHALRRTEQSLSGCKAIESEYSQENNKISNSLQIATQKLEIRTNQLKELYEVNEQLISVVEGYENLQIVNRDLLAKNFMLENQLQLLKKEDVEHHNALKQSAEYNEQLKGELREKDITVEKIANATVRLKARLGKFEKELCKFIVEKITDNFSSTAQDRMKDTYRSKVRDEIIATLKEHM